MVSGFPDVSKIVILFNCGIDSAELHEWLCMICNKQPQPGSPGLFAAAGVVVGVFAGSVNCGGTPSPYPEKRGRHRWRGIALYRAHRPKSNPEKLSKSEGKMGNNTVKARINGNWAECPWCRKKLCRVQEKWRAYGIELYCPRCKKVVMLERE